MKDSKGHGSNKRGGGRDPLSPSGVPLSHFGKPISAMAPAAHTQGVQSIPANMTKQHFVMIANMLKDQSAHTDPATHKANVARYADQLSHTNPRFDRNRFTKAAGG